MFQVVSDVMEVFYAEGACLVLDFLHAFEDKFSGKPHYRCVCCYGLRQIRVRVVPNMAAASQSRVKFSKPVLAWEREAR